MVVGLAYAAGIQHEMQKRLGSLYLRNKTLEYLEPDNKLLEFMIMSETGESVHHYNLDSNPVSFEYELQSKKFKKFSEKHSVPKPEKTDCYINPIIEHFSKCLDDEIKKWKKYEVGSEEGEKPHRQEVGGSKIGELGLFYWRYKTLEYIDKENVLLSHIKIRENGKKVDPEILPFCPVSFDYFASWENKPQRRDMSFEGSFLPSNILLNNNFRNYLEKLEREIMKFRKMGE